MPLREEVTMGIYMFKKTEVPIYLNKQQKNYFKNSDILKMKNQTKYQKIFQKAKIF